MSRRHPPLLYKRILFTGLLIVAAASPSGLAQTTETYEYDALGRLVKVDESASGDTAQYTYDAAGNRTQVSLSLANPASFSVDDITVTEGVGVTFTVTKTGATTLSHDVSYATADSSALAGSDYTAKTGTLTFAANETTKTASILTTDDSTNENVESFFINLTSPTNGAVIGDAQGVGTLNDNDPGPSFSVNNVTVTEGGTVTFTVTKAGSTALPHNVSYATANNSALSGSDYTAKSGLLSFNSSQTSKTVSVLTTNDSTDEYNQTFFINLTTPTNGAIISDSQGIGTINDNDPGPSFSVNNVTKLESLGPITFTVTKTGATEKTHAVSYTTANGTAYTPSDYTGKAGALSFPASTTTKWVTVTLIDDVFLEPTELFYLNLSAPTNSATISDSQGVGTIGNDDCSYFC